MGIHDLYNITLFQRKKDEASLLSISRVEQFIKEPPKYITSNDKISQIIYPDMKVII